MTYRSRETGTFLRVLTLFEVSWVELFEVGSQFRSGVERMGTGTGNIEAAERAVRAAAEAAKPPTPARHRHTSLDSFRADIDDDLEELTAASNAVIDMVHAGNLDEAERAARDLLVRFPEVHDGYDRLGMVYEARGDHKQAADYYRQVIDFVQSRPAQYEPGFETTFQRLIQKLDPPSTD